MFTTSLKSDSSCASIGVSCGWATMTGFEQTAQRLRASYLLVSQRLFRRVERIVTRISPPHPKIRQEAARRPAIRSETETDVGDAVTDKRGAPRLPHIPLFGTSAEPLCCHADVWLKGLRASLLTFFGVRSRLQLSPDLIHFLPRKWRRRISAHTAISSLILFLSAPLTPHPKDRTPCVWVCVG